IDPKDVVLSPLADAYTITTKDEKGRTLGIHISFVDVIRPTGTASLNSGHYAILLQPWAVTFNVNVSSDAGAIFSTGKQNFSWDENSDRWKNAHWQQNNMIFSYDTVAVPNPFGSGNYLINEVSFTDPEDPTNSFQLTREKFPKSYTSIMDGEVSPDSSYMATTVNDPADVPTPVSVRSGQAIPSVYPLQCLWKFDGFGTHLTGAYSLPNSDKIFAVSGTGVIPQFARSAPSNDKLLFHSALEPLLDPFYKQTSNLIGSVDLNVTGLLSMNPMQPTQTGFEDMVAAQANIDFHHIVCFHMDQDIRETFVQAGQFTIDDSAVLAIANDSPDNAEFYKTLQVPYVISFLARSTLSEAKECNGERADKILKDVPANSEIYKRHSDLLYRNQFGKLFLNMEKYLDDQYKNDYTADMERAAAVMKDQIREQSKGVNGPDPEKAAKILEGALADVDLLLDWAKHKRLYWAFQLYYWCQHFYLPMLYAQSVLGTFSQTVSMDLKKLSTVFGILEGSQQNPNGKSFQQAFNDLVQIFHMTAIIPQFVDAGGNLSDFDSILKAMLQQFADDNINNPDTSVAAEAQRAQKLASDDFLRKNFFNSLNESMRLAGTLGTWTNIVKLFGNLNGRSGWYQKLVEGAEMASTMLRSACLVLLVFPMINSLGGGWSSMSGAQQTGWIFTLTGLALTFTIKFIQGAIRVSAYWADLGGFSAYFKAFFGYESLLETLGPTSARVTNTFAKWFVRTGPEAMAMESEEVTMTMKIFGRSAGGFLANTVAAVLAGVNLVLSAIDIHNTSDDTQRLMDEMMIISSSFQLIAIAAGWLGAGIAMFETIAACAGPLAIVFAIAGLIVMIVMIAMAKPPNPVQDFLDKQGSTAGLKIDGGKTAIDYFNIVPSDANHTSLNGIDFAARLYNIPASKLLDPISGYLCMGEETRISPNAHMVTSSPKVTYMPDTCWCVNTDFQGNTMIFTQVLDSNASLVSLCLAELADGTLGALPPPSKSKDETFPTTATFFITRGDKRLYMGGHDGRVPTLGEPPVTGFSAWTLTVDPMGPSFFNYVQPNWILTTNSRDESDFVNFRGPTSTPLTWSISPPLPAFLTLVGEGINEGSINQKQGIAPQTMNKQTYTVTASISILNQKPFESTTTVVISVIETPPAPSPLEHAEIAIQDENHKRLGTSNQLDSLLGPQPEVGTSPSIA
ncbi:hypothetical protein B0J11DRAFT_449534, partial [Dendryphion nanum]